MHEVKKSVSPPDHKPTDTAIDTNHLEPNIETHVRDGIKYMFQPFKTNGEPDSTLLRASYGYFNYAKEFRSDELGKLCYIFKDNTNLFNRMIISYIGGTMKDKSKVFIRDDHIVIKIFLSILDEIYAIDIRLDRETIDEKLLLERKVQHLTEKLERYENTINYCFIINYEKYNEVSKEGKLDKRRAFIESKTEGFFSEISNYDLHLLLMDKLQPYRNMMVVHEEIIKKDLSHYFHPFEQIMRYEKNELLYLMIALTVLDRMGYELLKIIKYARRFEGCLGKPYNCLHIECVKTISKYSYEVDSINITDGVSNQIEKNKDITYHIYEKPNTNNFRMTDLTLFKIKKTKIE